MKIMFCFSLLESPTRPPAHALILFHSLQLTIKRQREQCKNQSARASNSFSIDADKAKRVCMHVFFFHDLICKETVLSHQLCPLGYEDDGTGSGSGDVC